MTSISRRTFLKLTLCAALTPVISKPLRALAAGPNHVEYLLRGNPRLPQVALTIDDCFSCRLLQRAEILLAGNQIPVTFFPTGKALEGTILQDASIWQRLAGQGHAIGYHGYTHAFASEQSLDELREDYDLWLAAAEHALGMIPEIRFARPPYGDLSYSFLDLCAEKSLVATLWSNSWGYSSETVGPVLHQTRSGDIILLHLRIGDLDNLELAVPVLQAKHLQPVTLASFDEKAPLTRRAVYRME